MSSLLAPPPPPPPPLPQANRRLHRDLLADDNDLAPEPWRGKLPDDERVMPLPPLPPPSCMICLEVILASDPVAKDSDQVTLMCGHHYHGACLGTHARLLRDTARAALDEVRCPVWGCMEMWRCDLPAPEIVATTTTETATTVDLAEEDALAALFKLSLGFPRCPGCRRVVERISGCNHMLCICGTSFCYGCGQERCVCGGKRLDDAEIDAAFPPRRRHLPDEDTGEYFGEYYGEYDNPDLGDPLYPPYAYRRPDDSNSWESHEWEPHLGGAGAGVGGRVPEEWESEMTLTDDMDDTTERFHYDDADIDDAGEMWSER